MSQTNPPSRCPELLRKECTDNSAPHYACKVKCIDSIQYKEDCDNLPSGETKCVYWYLIRGSSKPRYDFDNAKSIKKFVV
ncbi:hypothetical protein TVAG_178550 [Trichomonas vaginalis G3]|uniref:Uncharacterized protein n=1 Tax=Trichomonas vaginalis (strain ATCC PRA-98 / G3) TaxID=412133 RepID=A2DIK7_TRIV3|nr:hypothetical protein TVAGG3_0602580 [Trichomonas vaginalis G3]EAY19811.1 hypothetical protein TVAG_178550 [Trichomonas vaginalis G3]KAI5524014.1 hypothetical protein TVAGG3_0602580 [Trichomonas vaginalis G3]|eukprot:XP_001580797.1 hypothetical protein [Trichomonas vaginalis G3]